MRSAEEQLLVKVEHIEFKPLAAIEHLSSKTSRNESDHVLESFLINTRQRFRSELNEALADPIYEPHHFQLLTNIHSTVHESRLAECSSANASFGLKNVFNVIESSLKNSTSDLSCLTEQLSLADLLEYKRTYLHADCFESTLIKTIGQQSDIDLFDETSYNNSMNSIGRNNSKLTTTNNRENSLSSSSLSSSSSSAAKFTFRHPSETTANANGHEQPAAQQASRPLINRSNISYPQTPLPPPQPPQQQPTPNGFNASQNACNNGNEQHYTTSGQNDTSSLSHMNSNFNRFSSAQTTSVPFKPQASVSNSQTTTSLKYEPRMTKCYKRRNGGDDDEAPSVDYEKVDEGTPFRSAYDQLCIERNKKQQQQQQPQPQYQPYQQLQQLPQSESSSYSLAKRPMTNPPPMINPNPPTKRGVHGKFNLPIRSQSDDASKSNACAGNGAGSGNNGNNNQNKNNMSNNNNNNNVDMSNMKNIDEKLIEIIMSEVMDRTPPITWNDIAGLEFVKKTIHEIVIWPMMRPDIFNGLRGPPKGLLLFGPPGTGKTLIAKCIANESKSTFFNISSSTLTSKWQGESEKLVKVLFEVARSHQPSVIFIDEIDSLLAQRSDDDRESSRRLKTEFLVQMDGARTTGDERILLIGATNRPKELDDAARRRFVKKLYIPLPEIEGRKQIIVNLMRKQACELDDADVERIAELTDGYSGADMTNLCSEAALGPIRSLDMGSICSISVEQVRAINFQDFVDAMRQVRASVSPSDLDYFYKWNDSFGSVAIPK